MMVRERDARAYTSNHDYKLYRTVRGAVISAMCFLLLVQIGAGQSASGSKKQPKGPRALGLIELQPKGKARLIPIVILVDGEYYDASAYKAAPVPMALYAGTVYEGYRDGVSQGLLTLSAALSGQNNVWLGEGTWQTTEEIAAKKAKKPESAVPRGIEDTDAPPKLLRHAEKVEKKDSETSAAASPTPAAQSESKPAAASPAVAAPAPAVAAPPAATPAASAEPSPDVNVPTLKRGKTGESADLVTIPTGKSASAPAAKTSFAAPQPSKSNSVAAAAKKSEVQIIAAISDASSVESHSYDFPMKEGEEQTFRKKMLDLAAEDVLKRNEQLAGETVATPAGTPLKGKQAAKLVRPIFTDVNLKIFDLSSSNEPTIILSATAEVSHTKSASPRQYMVTLIAREDIYGDLHRGFSSVTDDQHLDAIPRMELIDAVDVDGDTRGELLFRQIYDTGSAYVIYRVIGAQVYALFQGTPS